MALQTATNPQTGERVALIGNSWKPITQSATNKEGVKAYLVDNKWLTDTPAAASTESEGRANVSAELPAFAKNNPNLYANLVSMRQTLGPTVEMLGGVGGGILGTAAGTVASPTVVINPVTGGVAGSALGYTTAKELLNKADVALGLAPKETVGQATGRAAGNLAEGAAYPWRTRQQSQDRADHRR